MAARERASSRGGAASPRREDRPEVPAPEAKRPLDASTIQVSVQGVRVMTIEDLSSAFFALNGRVERTEGHGTNLYETVDYNATLLSEVCVELAALKAAQAATSVEVGQTVLKLTGDTREAVAEVKSDLAEVHSRDIRDSARRAQQDGPDLGEGP